MVFQGERVVFIFSKEGIRNVKMCGSIVFQSLQTAQGGIGRTRRKKNPKSETKGKTQTRLSTKQ